MEQPIEDRIRVLEINATAHETVHAEQTEILQLLRQDVTEMKGWLGGNGSATFSIKEGRIRFAGSMSVRNSGLLGTGAVGGIIAVVLKALGWY